MKLPRLTEGDLVEILWHDASKIRQEETWVDIEKMNWEEEEMMAKAMQTVGYFAGLTKDSIFLAQSYSSGGWIMNIFSIPLGCVKVLEKK